MNEATGAGSQGRDVRSTGDMAVDWDRRARSDARWYVATGYAASDAEFFRSGAADVERLFRGADDVFDAPGGGRAVAVEIGCGLGRMTLHVAPRVARLYACDVSSEMLARAGEKLRGVSGVEFVQVDGRSLRPLEDASADLVFSAMVLQHMPRAAAAAYVIDALRVLRPGGRLVFHVPGPAPGETSPPDPPDADTWTLRWYSPNELRAGLTAAGFIFESCREDLVADAGGRLCALIVRARKP